MEPDTERLNLFSPSEKEKERINDMLQKMRSEPTSRGMQKDESEEEARENNMHEEGEEDEEDVVYEDLEDQIWKALEPHLDDMTVQERENTRRLVQEVTSARSEGFAWTMEQNVRAIGLLDQGCSKQEVIKKVRVGGPNVGYFAAATALDIFCQNLESARSKMGKRGD